MLPPGGGDLNELAVHPHAPLVVRSRPVIERLPVQVIEPVDLQVGHSGHIYVADAGAQCQLKQAEVSAPVLEPGGKPAAKAGAASVASAAAPKPAPAPSPKDGEHADLEARYTFQCAQPGQLRTLDFGLFDAYKRIQRIHVQVAGPKGQSKVTLRRPARSVALTR